MKAVIETQEQDPATSIGSLVTIILMNLWAYPLLILLTVVGVLVFPLGFAYGRLLLRWPADRLTRWAIWFYGRCWLMMMRPFVRFERQQMELLEVDKPYLFVINHLSFFDTFCMALLPIYNIAFAVRSWPFRMFWYRKFMYLARYLDVEAGRWDDNLASSKATFAATGSVLFFPEGHRSRDGYLQRFYSGGFKVAVTAGVAVVPLCIVGTDHLLPPGRKLMRPCRISLRVLKPIDTARFDVEGGHMQLRKLVKGKIEKNLAEMREEKY
ncbi:MAG: 1-acyl-sn-glycerol-3-phosphate acyltransferase [Thermodesulfobacteriota bacterium]|nr:1-acyl-sn-glycerol-3-phosphate acyltransferase [Thermodesulfobacteriota bacterium]